MGKKAMVCFLALGLWINSTGLTLAAPPPTYDAKELALRTYFENAITLKKVIIAQKNTYGFISITNKTRGWVIYQGKKVINDIRLAELAQEHDLALKLKQKQQNFWLKAAGAAALGLVGATIANSDTTPDSPDSSSIDFALGVGLTFGGFGTAVILLMESFQHQLTPQEAQVLADQYNTRLRQELGLTLKEVRIQ